MKTDQDIFIERLEKREKEIIEILKATRNIRRIIVSMPDTLIKKEIIKRFLSGSLKENIE